MSTDGKVGSITEGAKAARASGPRKGRWRRSNGCAPGWTGSNTPGAWRAAASWPYRHTYLGISLSPPAGRGSGRGVRTLQYSWFPSHAQLGPPLPDPLLQWRRGRRGAHVVVMARCAPGAISSVKAHYCLEALPYFGSLMTHVQRELVAPDRSAGGPGALNPGRMPVLDKQG